DESVRLGITPGQTRGEVISKRVERPGRGSLLAPQAGGPGPVDRASQTRFEQNRIPSPPEESASNVRSVEGPHNPRHVALFSAKEATPDRGNFGCVIARATGVPHRSQGSSPQSLNCAEAPHVWLGLTSQLVGGSRSRDSGWGGRSCRCDRPDRLVI